MSGLSPRTRLTVALAALLAGPVLVLADTAIALTRGWEPRGRLMPGATTFCVAAILLALAAVCFAAGRRLLAGRWAAAVALTGSLAFAWMTVEGVAAALPWLFAGRYAHSRGPDVQRTFRPDPRWVSGVRGASRYTTDALGIRGGPAPAAGVYKILCIGGSTTECTYLDDRETWPHLLMKALGARSGRETWVGGLGISGYAMPEHLDALRRSQRLDGIDCAVFLVGINDLVRFLNGSLELGPRPLWRRSALLEAILSLERRRALRSLIYEVEDASGANLQERRRLRRDGAEASEPPDLQPALRDYARRIAELAGLCRRRGVRCVFVTQPVLWREDLGPRARASLWMGDNGRGRYFSPAALRRGMDLYNATLLRQCDRLGLECVDLSPLSGREELFYDDCHFTEAGAREVARRIATHFLTRPEGPRG